MPEELKRVQKNKKKPNVNTRVWRKKEKMKKK
jgi:hypothetical protein